MYGGARGKQPVKVIPSGTSVRRFDDMSANFRNPKTDTQEMSQGDMRKYTATSALEGPRRKQGWEYPGPKFGKGRRSKEKYNTMKYTTTDSRNTKRSLFYDDTSSSPVNFSPNLQSEMYVNPKETIGGKGLHKLHILAVNDFFHEFNLTKDTTTVNTAWLETRNQFRRLVNDIQRETNNSSYKIVTLKSFSDYMNRLTRLLDLFYSVDSILSFKPEYESENSSLEALRYQLVANNPGIFEIQNLIRRALMNVAVPPNILEYYRWKNQAFRFSELGQSTSFKFTSGALFPDGLQTQKADAVMTDTTLWNAYVKIEIENFFESNNIIAPVLKARPEWLMTDLPVSPNTTVYDIKAIDIFCNFPIKQGNTIFPDPEVETREYMSVVNPSQQDGMIDAFVSFNENRSGFWGTDPSLEVDVPVTKLETNRWLISNEEDSEQWDPKVTPLSLVPDITEIGLTFNRAAFENQNNPKEYVVRHDGKIKVQVSSVEGIQLNSRLFLEWLFN